MKKIDITYLQSLVSEAVKNDYTKATNGYLHDVTVIKRDGTIFRTTHKLIWVSKDGQVMCGFGEVKAVINDL